MSLDYLYALPNNVIRPQLNGNVHFLPRRNAVPDEIFRFSDSTPSITPYKEQKVKQKWVQLLANGVTTSKMHPNRTLGAQWRSGCVLHFVI